MDGDSFIFYIKTEDIYIDIKKMLEQDFKILFANDDKIIKLVDRKIITQMVIYWLLMIIKQSNLLTEQKIKMDLYCIKCSKFTKNNNIKTNYKLDEENNLYSCCIDCGFKKFETIDKKQLSSLWKV